MVQRCVFPASSGLHMAGGGGNGGWGCADAVGNWAVGGGGTVPVAGIACIMCSGGEDAGGNRAGGRGGAVPVADVACMVCYRGSVVDG